MKLRWTGIQTKGGSRFINAMLVTSLEFRDDVVLVKLGADVIEAEWKGEPQAFLDYLAGDASVNWTEVYRQLGDPG